MSDRLHLTTEEQRERPLTPVPRREDLGVDRIREHLRRTGPRLEEEVGADPAELALEEDVVGGMHALRERLVRSEDLHDAPGGLDRPAQARG